MAKVKINKLPEGFELVDGKVQKVAKKEYGGTTGDQVDYGLVTTPQEYYGQTNFNNNLDNDVRYSLSRVPREDANVEAEGGETVLADLNNNGQFGLYDINGPRHSSGGVPMFLPEQSFIYSDTAALKFNKDEMAEFGIESGKRKTPAKISKKYPLNPYLGAINDQYADDISTLSAELMLKKNMNSLSKLAYGQELKKKFEDGVPLASYPYLQSQGVDPIDFTAKVEEISKKQAQLNLLESLPPEQQQAVIALQNMIQQVDQTQAPQPDQFIEYSPVGATNAPQPTVASEQQLAMDNQQMQQDMMAQRGGQTASSYAKEQGIAWPNDVKDPIWNEDTKKWEFDDGTPPLTKAQARGLAMRFNSGQPVDDMYKITVEEDVTSTDDAPAIDNNNDRKIKNPLPKGHPQYQDFEDAINRGYVIDIIPKYDPVERKTTYKLMEEVPNKLNLPPRVEILDSEVKTVQRDESKAIDILKPDEKKILGIVEEYPNVSFRAGILAGRKRDPDQPAAGINSAGADLMPDVFREDFELRWGEAWKGGTFEGANGETVTIPPIEDFEWGLKLDKDPNSRYHKQWLQVQKNMQLIDDTFNEKYGLPKRELFPGTRQGEKFDGVLGLHTFNRDRRFLNQPGSNEIVADVLDPEGEDPKPIMPSLPPQAEPWLQDVLAINAQNQLDNPLILPVNPKIPRQKIDYVLDDYTGKVNNINAALNTKLQQLGAFAGKSGVAGADIGKAVELSENAINTTNTNNVGIVNQIAPMQARLDMENNLQNVKLRMDQDEGTNLALQRFTDFKNWDTLKSTELMNNLITNQANTFNLNMARPPQFRVDPTVGGEGYFTGIGRPNMQTDQTSPAERRRDAIIDTYNWMRENEVFNKDGVVDTNLLEFIVGSQQNDQEDPNDMKNPYQTYPGAPSVIPNNPPNTSVKGKRGNTELKKFAYPFYSGKMGI
jgi:hypothetical protein